ncbi:hypothetical protein T10_840 [Trichinella papuae]|uniref:Uncharacterized protein n=1 Tax=Trichinella papuae TaxID=268474 RepID=A0A0V1MKA5_9BILA|nr:hypothetical protein T10_840 [Trichinella papuae]
MGRERREEVVNFKICANIQKKKFKHCKSEFLDCAAGQSVLGDLISVSSFSTNATSNQASAIHSLAELARRWHLYVNGHQLHNRSGQRQLRQLFELRVEMLAVTVECQSCLSSYADLIDSIQFSEIFLWLLGPADLNLATTSRSIRRRPSTGRREQLLKTPEQAGKQAGGLKSLLECKGGRQISALKHLSMLAGYERRSKTR